MRRLLVSVVVLAGALAGSVYVLRPAGSGRQLSADQVSASARLVSDVRLVEDDSRVTGVLATGGAAESFWAVYPTDQATAARLVDSLGAAGAPVTIVRQPYRPVLRDIAEFVLPPVLLVALAALSVVLWRGRAGDPDASAASAPFAGPPGLGGGGAAGGPGTYGSATARYADELAAEHGPAPGWAYARLQHRLGGFLIDAAVVVALALALVAPLHAYAVSTEVTGTITARTYHLTAGGDVLVGLVVLLYLSVSWWLAGATPGQWAVGVHVSQLEDGRPPSLWRSLVRASWFGAGPLLSALTPWLGLVTLFAVLGMAMMLDDPRRQGWHDRSARTVVVRRAR